MASNLFLINFHEIARLLAEANAQLLKRRDEVLEQFNRISEQLGTDGEVKYARDALVEIVKAERDARQERLMDERPFKDAVKIVKEFYSPIEGPLKEAEQAVIGRLTDAGAEIEPDNSADPIGASQNKRIASGNHPRGVKRVWSVAGVDPKTVELEKLRDYLSESCLLAACRKHLADHGANQLTGVEYRQVAQLT